ncbi:MAG: 6,7-dimethyl-8-ribityllumazine synthase [Saprospiraceae bacterium]|nr:6,7-dimethyl-8-ribityllumazine synthase [Candidatus Vicinibacter affinis]
MSGKSPSSKNLKEGNIPGLVILAAEWHEDVIQSLLIGCLNTLKLHGIGTKSVTVRRVPGSFELPLAAQWYLEKDSTQAVICLGCVIKGETQHDEIINHSIAKAFQDLNLKFGKPVLNGVLTTLNKKQAKARAGGKHGNKGSDCALAAIKMIQLKEELDKLK